MSEAEALEHLRAGRPRVAADLLEILANQQTADARTWFLLGACRHALNELPAALKAISRSLALDPTSADTYFTQIAVLRDIGDNVAAVMAGKHALDLLPNDSRLHYAVAICSEELGRVDHALKHYDDALTIAPRFEDALHNRGMLLARARRFADAEKNQRNYIAAYPGTARAYCGLADILIAQGRFDEAIQVLAPVVNKDVTARIRCGVAHASMRLFAEATRDFCNARESDAEGVERYVRRVAAPLNASVALSPVNIYLCRAWQDLGQCDWGSWSEFVAEMHGVAIDPAAAIEPAVAFMSRLLPLSGGERHAIARCVAKPVEAQAPALPPAAPRQRPRLRIGVLSPDLREHLNAYLLLPFFELLDRKRFELFAYSLAADDASNIRSQLRSSADSFVDMQYTSDRDAAMRIRRDDIDVLLDVGGYTTGTRFAITAQRAARVQVNYLGFSSSLGSYRVDYAIVDPISSGDDAEWTEARICLPHTHFLYDFRAPVPTMQVSRRDYALPEDAFIYCAFHRAEKISPDVFDLWVQILSRVPTSVLWFRALTEAACHNLRAHARQRGIDPARLAFAPFEPSHDARYLARHRLGDLMLDALHHNATTSACDALAAGLPLLSIRGSTMASRTGESLLRAAGLPELVAPDKDAYVELAVRLASDRERLNGYRRTLEARTGPLFDTAGRVREIETALLHMWQQYQARH